MNIGSGKGYPASALSNFSPYVFIFDGVSYASMEGLFQAFKYDKEHIQIVVCLMVGKQAKFKGKKRNKAWKSKQTLWWKGKAYGRKSKEYQELLDRAFDALATNEKFCKALLASGDSVLKHTIGSSKKSDTVLTESEFCRRLTKIRERLK